MDLNYKPEDIAFRKQVRPWLEQNLPKKKIANFEERRARHRKLFEAGYLGMGWPEENGGGGRAAHGAGSMETHRPSSAPDLSGRRRSRSSVYRSGDTCGHVFREESESL
jgi:alkylation response protein AidB-like acyl-CoA dehydrogenase